MIKNIFYLCLYNIIISVPLENSDTFMFPEYDQYFHNDKPVIGVLTQPSLWSTIYPSEDYSYIAASYVKFLESSGARVVPIKYDLPTQNLTRLFQ